LPARRHPAFPHALARGARLTLAVALSGAALGLVAPYGAAASTSSTASTTPSGSITTLSPGSQTVAPGARTQLLAHIMSGRRELVGVEMDLYSLQADGKLVYLERKTTDGTGHAHFYRYPKNSVRYVAKFPGTSTYKTSKSGAALVNVAAPQPSFGSQVVTEASHHYGAPYQYGATGPSRFDCSGFTMYVFGRFGRSLPHSSAQQYNSVQRIDRSAARAGDLVFFHSSSGAVYHVGIYAGSGDMWAATHSGDIVRHESIYSSSVSFGRVG
jgi:cell wall-associated NlpC family hydrolase